MPRQRHLRSLPHQQRRPRQSHLRSLRHWQRRPEKTLVQKHVGLETRGAIFRELGAVNKALEPNVCGEDGRWMTA